MTGGQCHLCTQRGATKEEEKARKPAKRERRKKEESQKWPHSRVAAPQLGEHSRSGGDRLEMVERGCFCHGLPPPTPDTYTRYKR